MNPVLDIFEATVKQYPQRTALADRKKTYTFSSLRESAKRLAGRIQMLQGRNRGIGVFAERTADTGVMFLAVVYSGNYYIPLDPLLPVPKLKAILEDSGVQLVVGIPDNREKLEEAGFGGSFITIEDSDALPVDVPEAFADTPLYMVYTSGSTGKPKGVLKSHGAVVSYLDAYVNTFGFDENEIIGNQTPFYFDASAKDFYLMMKTGAAVEIIPTEYFAFPVQLIHYLNERKVTFISWVPTALSIVTQLNTFQEVLPTTLKRVFFVGEVFPRKQLEKWRCALPDLEYVNLYGSSELAGVCCFYRINGELPEGSQLPLGKPLCNCRVFLADEKEIIQEPGKVGEIHVASDALALEYFHDPEKTEKSFQITQLPDGTSARVFRTGDLASYDGSGNLVFAARKDFQIKHQGRRIELGEIEAVAGELPEIQNCCCLYNTEKKQITLFAELDRTCEWNSKDVRRALKGHLADYMMPTKVILLEKLPLNANGKIDRQSLKKQMEKGV